MIDSIIECKYQIGEQIEHLVCLLNLMTTKIEEIIKANGQTKLYIDKLVDFNTKYDTLVYYSDYIDNKIFDYMRLNNSYENEDFKLTYFRPEQNYCN